jgi:hypothetical protein
MRTPSTLLKTSSTMRRSVFYGSPRTRPLRASSTTIFTSNCLNGYHSQLSSFPRGMRVKARSFINFSHRLLPCTSTITKTSTELLLSSARPKISRYTKNTFQISCSLFAKDCNPKLCLRLAELSASAATTVSQMSSSNAISTTAATKST